MKPVLAQLDSGPECNQIMTARRAAQQVDDLMRTFTYDGMTFSGQPVSGEIRARNEAELVDVLRADGILLVESRRAVDQRPWLTTFARNRHDASVTRYFRHLSTLVGAGIPLSRALDGLAERARGSDWKEIVTNVADRVRLGSSLADALQDHEHTFLDIAIPMIAAGEAGGKLGDVLDRIAVFRDMSA